MSVKVTPDTTRTALWAELYAWLAAAFYQPEPEMADPEFAREGLRLRELLLPEAPDGLLRKLEQANSAAASPDDRDAGYTRKPIDHENRILELGKEHARLFIGPPKGLVRPYESCYFGEDRLMGEQTLEVDAFLGRHGIALHREGHCEPPDHISVQLEFLSMVCNGEVPTDGGTPGEKTGTDTARHPVEELFLREHLARWGLLFAHTIRNATSEPLYLAAADLLEAVVWPYAGENTARGKVSSYAAGSS